MRMIGLAIAFGIAGLNIPLWVLIIYIMPEGYQIWGAVMAGLWGTVTAINLWLFWSSLIDDYWERMAAEEAA